MKCAVIFLFVAVCSVALATRCQHGDVTQCTGITCTNQGEIVGCQHETCTCVPEPKPCLDQRDCMSVTCEKHDETSHCVDAHCLCFKAH